LIEDLKLKTGITLLVNKVKKHHDLKMREALKVWRINSGVAIMQHESQEKSLIMARAITKIIRKGLNH
jgi:hypothetical protein